MKVLNRHTIRTVRNALLRLRYPGLKDAFYCVSHLTTEERIMLFRLSRRYNIVLEIGSYVGASACCFGAALQECGKGQIFCIDTWANDAMSEGHRDTWLEFCSNTKRYSQFILPVRGYSTEVVAKVRQQTSDLDLLFIDGDHSYEGVKADWEAYKGFLHPGSVVAFHDYGWAEGVQRVVNEDVMSVVIGPQYLPNMWWGTIAKKP